MSNINKINECIFCKNSKKIFNSNHHLGCKKPDPKMVGVKRGRENGWFNYPDNFDPVWKEKDCSNFEKKDGDNE